MSTVVDNMLRAPLEPPGPCAARIGRLDAGPDVQHPARAEGIPPTALTTATLSVADEEIELDDRVPTFYDGPIPNDIARRAWVLIRSRATKLCRAYRFDRSTRRDIRQELWHDLLRRWPTYDPSRSPAMAFVASVTRNRVYDIMAGRVGYLKSQLFFRTSSLNKTIKVCTDGQEVERGHWLVEAVHERRTGIRQLTRREQAELEHDVTRLLAKLPTNERRVCEMLMKFSPAETARRLGMAESTFRDGLKSLRISLTSLVNYVKPAD
jgi:RNA polymerase sigma factor (sigma-70 family)